MEQIGDKLSGLPNIILIDFDGVLTDGKLYIDHKGEKLFKALHSRDIRAIRELVAIGYRVVIVTADDSDFSASYAEKIGVEIYITRDKSDLPFENYIAIGDDAWDRKMLEKAVKAYIPLDADKSVLDLDKRIVINQYAGRGVIAEFIHLIQ